MADNMLLNKTTSFVGMTVQILPWVAGTKQIFNSQFKKSSYI